MDTPAPKYICPRCLTAHEVESSYCGKCGANMHRASALDTARRAVEPTHRQPPLARAQPGDESPSGGQPSRESSRRQQIDRAADALLDELSDPDDDDSGEDDGEDDRSSGTLTEPGMATHDLDSGHRARMRRFSDRRDQWLGRIIDGRYRVSELIGRGGMGMVYKVEHLRMGKVAAMKVLHHELAGDPEVIGRFRREAEAVSMLNHPNTVQVFDFGTARGALYLIMEYVRGRDLNAVIKRDGPLPFARAAPLLGQVCGAMAEAHERGVIHRDLKPENVLVTRTQRGRDFVKVLDFGLAKLSQAGEGASEVTDRGAIVGTPYYMSPEQIRGDDVDERTDVYSFGALMYRVLTGTHPFTAKTPVGVLTKHLTSPLEPPSERAPELAVPPEVDRIVLRAMAKDRGERYRSASEVIDDLERAYTRLHEGSGAVTITLAGMSMTPVPGSVSVEPRARGAGADDSVDYGIDSAVRLRRSDLDAFEASLRRRRVARVALVPLLLAGACAAVVYLVVLRPAAPQTAEREPNDELDDATLIAPGTDVTGLLGKRISPRRPDRDYYRVVAAAGNEPMTVTAHLQPPPNIDAELALVDALGNPIARGDEFGVGEPEHIRGRRVEGIVYLQVTESFDDTAGRLPVENVSDRYTLSVTRTAIVAGVETEPNDGAGDAIALAPGAPITGYLDRRVDVDTYQLAGEPGSYRVTIRGADGVPLTWRAGNGPLHTEREAAITLESGALIRLERGDASRPRGEPLPGADQPYELALAPVAAPVPTPGEAPAPTPPPTRARAVRSSPARAPGRPPAGRNPATPRAGEDALEPPDAAGSGARSPDAGTSRRVDAAPDSPPADESPDAPSRRPFATPPGPAGTPGADAEQSAP